MKDILKDIRKGWLRWYEVLPFLLWLLKKRAAGKPSNASVTAVRL